MSNFQAKHKHGGNHITQPYLCLLGSIGNTWRKHAQAQCDAQGIPWRDTLDPAWDKINHENGDEHQHLINQLVARQHQHIDNAAVVLFQHDAHDEHGRILQAYAARCELGYLTGRGIPSFVYINHQVIGRNYLRAQLKPHPHMKQYDSPEEALQQALNAISKQNIS